MADNKDFQVNYHLNVKAGEGVEQLKHFTAAVANLANSQKQMESAAGSINKMFDNINTIFKNGNKRSYNLKFNTGTASKQLDGLLTKLTSIEKKSQSIALSFGSTAGLDQRELRKRMAMYAKARAADKSMDQKNMASANGFAANAANAAGNIISQAKTINGAIGKTVSGLKQLQSGFDVNIRTDKAKASLNELIGLMRLLKREANINVIGLGGMAGRPTTGTGSSVSPSVSGYMPMYMSSSRGVGSTFYSSPSNSRWRSSGSNTGFSRIYQTARLGSGMSNDKNRWRLAASNAQTVPFVNIPTMTPALTSGSNNNVPPPIIPASAPSRPAGGGSWPRHQAALNRLQYSSTPSWRNLPFAGMLNAYFMYNAVKSELGDAIAFTHTVDAAKQVLLTTDTDLGTFSERFSSMMANVRKIGVDTRFTMVEMAKATQYMAQAGFNTDQINSAIRPISDLALIADAPIQDIADNMTGVLSGYRIDTGSTNSLADQMSATYTRSKATMQEMSESFKMSAGFLQMAGVDISEAIAAFGVLGNANLRGTMAGTSMRSMMTFLAKPTKTARKTLDRLGVDITQTVEIYGKTVKQLRPLSDIFSDLKKSGVTLEDMSAIFGKIGGTGAMVLASRSDELRELTENNLHSQGIAHKLGMAKQETTSGLWEQVTSQWSESFTQVFESLEPRIKMVLKSLTSALASDDFTAGLHTFAESLLSVFDIASKIGVWFVSNWSWIEPLLITGMVAKNIMAVAGTLSNLFIVIRGAATVSTAAGLANTASGISAIGANMGGAVNNGRGLVGAVASVGSLGGTALSVASGVAVLGGALAYAAYEGYQLNQRKEALQEELDSNRKYYYPSIESLKSALDQARQAAVDAKIAKDDLTSEATVGERFNNVDARSNIFSQWGHGVIDWMSNVGLNYSTQGAGSVAHQEKLDILRLRKAGKNKEADIKQQNLDASMGGGYNSNYQVRMRNIGEVSASKTFSEVEAQAWDYLDKNPTSANASSASIYFKNLLTPSTGLVDYSLYNTNSSGQYILKPNLDKSKKPIETRLITHSESLQKMAEDKSTYSAMNAASQALGSSRYARDLMFGKDTDKVKDFYLSNGYVMSNGKLVPQTLGKNATETERAELNRKHTEAQQYTYELISRQAEMFGGKTKTTAAILKNTGVIPEDTLINKVRQDGSYIDPSNFRSEDASAGGGAGGFGGAGGNYGGSGKIHSATPKQVNVSITNLMSIDTIKLMSTSEGQNPDVQNLKEQLTQALIEVVHDFDSSWNA